VIACLFLDKMISRLEASPNEVLLFIFQHLSCLEMLTSFWSLNQRFNSLIYSIFSIHKNPYNSGLIFTQPGFSRSKWFSTLFPFICHSSSPLLASYIKYIHFDGTNSSVCDLSYEWLFEDIVNNERKILRYPNLKSLILTRCLLIEPLVKTLSLLIEYQLDELTLSFDEELIYLAVESELSENVGNEGNAINPSKQPVKNEFLSV
jgi:hypothetical protein